MPLRVAIVGAGPAGFYAAERLLERGGEVEVELFDRLATPWGLVRAGVAPDHPKIKGVSRMFERTAKLPGFRFHGHVEVGCEIQHEELAAHHHAVVYAYGAARDRRLGIAGEDLPGCHAATDFVAWYNGHPDAADLEFDLSGRRAVVVGNGNVALDVARMLVLTREELAGTDVADHALEALARSAIEEVVVVGRRGVAQAAYTTPEVRELGELRDADVVVDPAEAVIDEPTRRWLSSDAADGTARRNVEVVTEFAGRALAGKRRRVVLRYLLSPTRVCGDHRVEGIELVRNTLVHEDGVAARAQATGQTEWIDCGMLLRSVGYLGASIKGVPFDERRGVVANQGGRVLDPRSGRPVPGVYTAGWIKRGPSGVIGTNRKCAKETVDALLADANAGRLPEPAGTGEQLQRLLGRRAPERVDYSGWELIDEYERARGAAQSRPRVKLTRREQLLARVLPTAGRS